MTHPLYNNTGLQKNNKSHVLYALANKQMELKQIEIEYETKIKKLKTDLIALETTICLFDENGVVTIKKLNEKSTKSIAKTRNRFFENGEAKKLVLKVLRTSFTSLKTDEISLKVQELKNIDINDNEINRSVQKSIVLTLRTLEKQGLVIMIGKDGLSIIWKIKD